jgi:hypothetical protein
MKDYLKTLIRRKPDEIILHIGTNNPKDANMEPQNLAEGIIFLVLHYKLTPTLLLRKYLFLA